MTLKIYDVSDTYLYAAEIARQKNWLPKINDRKKKQVEKVKVAAANGCADDLWPIKKRVRKAWKPGGKISKDFARTMKPQLQIESNGG